MESLPLLVLPASHKPPLVQQVLLHTVASRMGLSLTQLIAACSVMMTERRVRPPIPEYDGLTEQQIESIHHSLSATARPSTPNDMSINLDSVVNSLD